jgi:purine nucleoside phosphorylase
VLDQNLPLDQPLLLSDLIMHDNSLPDGSACTMFPVPEEGQGHLVLDEGIFSKELSDQMASLAAKASTPVAASVVFVFTKGPRTKTAAENAMWAKMGGQVNSMTVAPEVVLANELGIPTAGLVVGHKYSLPGVRERLDHAGISRALKSSWKLLDHLATVFLKEAQPVPFQNRIFRV